MPALKNIMLVENEADIRDAACVCLKDLGDFEVTLCESGQEALDKFAEAKPQLILMDVMMPGMNGLMAFDRIKNLPGGKDVPVVFVTARAHAVQINEYITRGAAGVIAKPFDPLTIIKEISTIWDTLNGQATQPPAAESQATNESA